MKKILIVEDKNGLRKVLKELLKRLDYDVVEAENGKSGLNILKNETVDLVIMDHVMPGMSGIEMLFELKDRADIKKIMMTGQVVISKKDSFKDLATKFGAGHVLHKPFKLNELVLAIEDSFEHRRNHSYQTA